MDFLWAPWRMAYIDGEKEHGCIFCPSSRKGSLRDNLILAETSSSVVMLNKYPYNNGHLLVSPKHHTNELEELSPREHLDLLECLRKSVLLIREVLSPGGVNLGMNLGRCAGAGVEEHLHWHVVPRWEGDTNFMAVIGSVKVIPQHLLEGYDRLRPYFIRLEESGDCGS
jgi:ATP adenylyltransferase